MVLKALFRGTAISVVFVSAVLSGCTYSINARLPVQPVPPGDRIPENAAVIIPPEEAQLKQPITGMLWVGAAHTWVLESGEAMMNYSGRYFPAIFSTSKLFSVPNSKTISSSYTVLVEPKLSNVSISQSFHTTLTLSCTVKDRNGAVIYDRSFVGETQRSGVFTKACLGGVFTGESAMEDTFSDALEHAFNQLTVDMRTSFKPVKASVADPPK